METDLGFTQLDVKILGICFWENHKFITNNERIQVETFLLAGIATRQSVSRKKTKNLH